MGQIACVCEKGTFSQIHVQDAIAFVLQLLEGFLL